MREKSWELASIGVDAVHGARHEVELQQDVDNIRRRSTFFPNVTHTSVTLSQGNNTNLPLMDIRTTGTVGDKRMHEGFLRGFRLVPWRTFRTADVPRTILMRCRRG